MLALSFSNQMNGRKIRKKEIQRPGHGQRGFLRILDRQPFGRLLPKHDVEICDNREADGKRRRYGRPPAV